MTNVEPNSANGLLQTWYTCTVVLCAYQGLRVIDFLYLLKMQLAVEEKCEFLPFLSPKKVWNSSCLFSFL